MTWNYRLCKETYSKGTQDEEVGFEIREAYYNKSGGVWAVTETAARPFGESPDELKNVLERMNTALEKDIIDLDTFVFAKPDFDSDEVIEDAGLI